MSVSRELIGRMTSLVPVAEDDACFIISLWSDRNLNMFLPPINKNEEFQRDWIKQQRVKEGDYYYVIKNKQNNKRYGVMGLTDCTTETAQVGRTVCRLPIHFLEAKLLLCDFAFELPSRQSVFSRVACNNIKSISHHRTFGYSSFTENESEHHGLKFYKFVMTRDDYLLFREKYIRVIQCLAKRRA